MLLNILVALVLLAVVGAIGIITYIFIKVRSVANDIKAFIYPLEEGKPSALAESAQVVADMVARSMVAQVKTTLMGMESGLVRSQKALDGAVVDDMIAQSNPLISGLLSAFPNVRKMIKKNPALLDSAIGLLAKSKIAQPTSSGNGQGKITEFKL